MFDGNGVVYKVSYIDGTVDYVSDEDIDMVRDRDNDTILYVELYEDNTITPFWNSRQYGKDIGFRE